MTIKAICPNYTSCQCISSLTRFSSLCEGVFTEALVVCINIVKQWYCLAPCHMETFGSFVTSDYSFHSYFKCMSMDTIGWTHTTYALSMYPETNTLPLSSWDCVPYWQMAVERLVGSESVWTEATPVNRSKHWGHAWFNVLCVSLM